MRHYTKQAAVRAGIPIIRLIDNDGDPVSSFDDFAELLTRKGYAHATVKRYLEVVAAFLDYLTEAGVFGVATAAHELNRVIESYLQVVGRATEFRAAADVRFDPLLRWAKPIAEALDLNSVSVAANTMAAINLFLRQSNLNLQAELDRAAEVGLSSLPPNLSGAIRVVDGHQRLTRSQQKALKQKSMLASVIRLRPEGLLRPRNLALPRNEPAPEDETGLHFPLEGLAPLFAAARSHRDSALWLALAGGGLRTSEAQALNHDHIDPVGRRLFVEDPNHDRSRPNEPSLVPKRFKGRAVAEVYLFEPLKTQFFKALAAYFREEYVPGCGHDFVFQDIRPGAERGRPMHLFSDTARLKAFHAAVDRAGIAHPRNGYWGLHSLRHTYGVYMLNYIPVPGGYGLLLNEVQRLMGHRNQATTAHYARSDRLILASKLAWSDGHVVGGGAGIATLPSFVMRRLRQEADRLEEALS